MDRPIAWEGETLLDGALRLAVHAADAIDACVVAIDIALVSGRMVVWDALPAADFRKSTPLGATSVGEAIAALAMRRAGRSATGTEVPHVVALSA